MKTLGIVGGMGPEATADLYSKVIQFDSPVEKDQEHIHIIIDSYSQIPDRTAAILGDGEDPVPYLSKSAKMLEEDGADVLIMPCNTAHYFLPQLKETVSIPFISIIESAVGEIKNTAPEAKVVMPISTTGTKSTGLYENALREAGYTVPEIPEDLQNDIMSCIYDGVKKGKTAEYVDKFQSVLDRIASDIKPDCLLAACTEIPILLPHVHTEIPMVDATLALAKNAAAYCED